MDITQSGKDKARMEDILVNHVKDTIRILERRSEKTIKCMYIGKTYTDVREGETFNRLNHETWKMSDRLSDHNDKYYAKDGKVVLCAFTESDLPAGSRRSQEFLAVAMEQRLIHHFQIFETNKLVANKTFDQGGISNHTNNCTLRTSDSVDPPKPNHHAYVVYMTFAYDSQSSSIRSGSSSTEASLTMEKKGSTESSTASPSPEKNTRVSSSSSSSVK